MPENRAAEETREIRLAFIRLQSGADRPGPPLFLLPGGPGNAATPLARSPLWSRYLELGDVVLMDPRGTGRSEPDLLWSSDSLSPELLFTERETAVAHLAEVGGEAARHFATEGCDLAGYNTREMALDIDALRRALGYEQVHLFGHSFGTHLGLEILRRFPSTVARFVAVGTAGTGDMMKLPGELDARLARLAAVIAADPVVGAEMPDFAADVRTAIEQLRDEPLLVPVVDPRSRQRRIVELGSFGMQLLLLADLGDSSDLPAFPRLVDSVGRRDASVVSWFLQKRMAQFSRLPLMMFAVRGASGATAQRWRQIDREAAQSPFGKARCLFSPELDRALGVADLGDAFRQPVTSDVPALFVSGTLDAHTPPEQAEAVRAGFPNSGHLIVENGGHEDLIPDPQVQARILAFLGGDAPSDDRVARPPLRFAPLDGSRSEVSHPALR